MSWLAGCVEPPLALYYGYDVMGQLQEITSGSGPGVDLV